MSTILDSLKKSSDQRSENNDSSMDNFNFGSAKKKSKLSSLLFYALVFLLLLAILYYAYDYYLNSNDTATVESNHETQVAQNDKVTNDEGDFQKKDKNPKLAQRQAKINNPSQRKKQKPNSTKVKKDLKERIRLMQERQAKEKESLQKLNSPNYGKEIAKEVQTKRPEIKKPPVVKLEMPKKKSEQIRQKPKEIVAKQKPQKPKHNYKYIYQLPFSIRKEIPQLKLNMHVYDENPENRLVVINGVKFAIDDMIEEIILVKDIIREGVVLEFNDKVFLVPKL